MMAEVLRFSEVAQSFPGKLAWKILSYNQSHVEWAGCSLHDMIQPSFSFLWVSHCRIQLPAARRRARALATSWATRFGER
jgi:hypothetical protein